MDHRYGERYAVRQPVYLQSQDAVIAAGWLIEVSLSGGCVITHRPMAPDVSLQVRLPTSGLSGRGRKFCLTAQIVRATRYGWALEWDQLLPQLLAQLVLDSRRSSTLAIEATAASAIKNLDLYAPGISGGEKQLTR